MKSVLNWISGIVLSLAIGVSLLAIGNGKILTMFGEELFLASPSDMKGALVLLFLAAPATIWLLFSVYERGQRIQEWEDWYHYNKGLTIPK